LANFFNFYIIFSDLSKYMPNFFFAKIGKKLKKTAFGNGQFSQEKGVLFPLPNSKGAR